MRCGIDIEQYLYFVCQKQIVCYLGVWMIPLGPSMFTRIDNTTTNGALIVEVF